MTFRATSPTGSIERIWRGERPHDRAIRSALVPLSLLYGGAAMMREAYWRRNAEAAPVPLISVGNLTVGGNAKTPFTIFLANRLRAKGLRVGIVSRGYGRRARNPVLVSDGRHLVAEPPEAGDEPVVIARSFAGPVAVARRRIDAVRLLLDCTPLDVVIMDDAFQHLRLKRGLDVVMIRNWRAIESERVLPAGPLRESIQGLRRADVVILVDEDANIPNDETALRSYLRHGALVLQASVRPAALIKAERGLWTEAPLDLQGREVVVVSGIANPKRFHAVIEHLGARISAALDFSDHHDYGPGDWENIMAASGKRLVLTTEKDLVKLERFVPAGFSLLALRIEIELGHADEQRLIGMAADVITSKGLMPTKNLDKQIDGGIYQWR
jgi:tetraacyldisaccharide 4'-kinase